MDLFQYNENNQEPRKPKDHRSYNNGVLYFYHLNNWEKVAGEPFLDQIIKLISNKINVTSFYSQIHDQIKLFKDSFDRKNMYVNSVIGYLNHEEKLNLVSDIIEIVKKEIDLGNYACGLFFNKSIKLQIHDSFNEVYQEKYLEIYKSSALIEKRINQEVASEDYTSFIKYINSLMYVDKNPEGEFIEFIDDYLQNVTDIKSQRFILINNYDKKLFEKIKEEKQKLFILNIIHSLNENIMFKTSKNFENIINLMMEKYPKNEFLKRIFEINNKHVILAYSENDCEFNKIQKEKNNYQIYSLMKKFELLTIHKDNIKDIEIGRYKNKGSLIFGYKLKKELLENLTDENKEKIYDLIYERISDLISTPLLRRDDDEFQKIIKRQIHLYENLENKKEGKIRKPKI